MEGQLYRALVNFSEAKSHILSRLCGSLVLARVQVTLKSESCVCGSAICHVLKNSQSLVYIQVVYQLGFLVLSRRRSVSKLATAVTVMYAASFLGYYQVIYLLNIPVMVCDVCAKQ